MRTKNPSLAPTPPKNIEHFLSTEQVHSVHVSAPLFLSLARSACISRKAWHVAHRGCKSNETVCQRTDHRPAESSDVKDAENERVVRQCRHPMGHLQPTA